MKQTTRIIAMVTALLLCVSLTGCKALDDMRAVHGTWNEDGSISLGDTRYLPLPECDLLSPPSANYYADTVYVTDKDVPVLLSQFFKSFSMSDDGVLLEDETRFYDEVISFYCREDRYESLLKQIQEGPKLNGFYYSYYGSDNMERYVLTPAQADAVNFVLDTITPHTVYSLDWDYCVTLTACSEDQYFNGAEYDLLSLKNRYYLVVNAIYSNQEPLICDVPAEYYSMFSDIMRNYIENEDALENEYEDWETDDYYMPL